MSYRFLPGDVVVFADILGAKRTVRITEVDVKRDICVVEKLTPQTRIPTGIVQGWGFNRQWFWEGRVLVSHEKGPKHTKHTDNEYKEMFI